MAQPWACAEGSHELWMRLVQGESCRGAAHRRESVRGDASETVAGPRGGGCVSSEWSEEEAHGGKDELMAMGG